MIQAVDDYIEGHIELGALVNMRESSLHASELKNEVLKQNFLDHWGPLEDDFAIAKEMGTPLNRDHVRETAIKMRAFLVSTLGDVMAYDPGQC
jgi:hypothetical protein